MFAKFMKKIHSFFNKKPIQKPMVQHLEMSEIGCRYIVEPPKMGFPNGLCQTTKKDTKKTVERHGKDIQLTQAKSLTTLFFEEKKTNTKTFFYKKKTQKRQWYKWKKRR